MGRQLGWAAWLAVFVLVGTVANPSEAQDSKSKIRVVIIDGQNNHNWRATTPFMKKALEECGRFTVDVATTPERTQPPKKPKSEDPEVLAKYKAELAKFKAVEAAYRGKMEQFHPKLSNYDVVVSNYNGDSWGKAFQGEFEEVVKSGKIGLVIVHAANNSFGGWKEYNLMIGMGWRGNSFGDRLTLDPQGKETRVEKGKGPGAGHGSQHPFTVTMRDRSHPVTKGMPAEWLHAADELYHGMRGPIANVHLLATSFSNKKTGGSGEHEPMIWTVTYGQGRVFHTPMGHDLNGMRCLGFVATLQRGTEWAATSQVTLPLPANFPSADKVSQVPAK